MTTFRFKNNHNFEKRFQEAHRIMNKYKKKIPIIVEKSNNYNDLPDIDRSKYWFLMI